MVNINLPPEYVQEYSENTKRLKDYPYQKIAQELGKHYKDYENKHLLIAGLIGVISQESRCIHTIMNRGEYYGKSTVAGTTGWGCGEGLIQWTFWNNKKNFIKKYNDTTKYSKIVEELPDDWDDYNVGEPVLDNSRELFSAEDGLHIAGLCLEDQIVFLVIFYNTLVKKIVEENETDLALITAKMYQEKSGYKNKYSSNEIENAYETAENKYPMKDGQNHYLSSLKVAEDYANIDIDYVDNTEPVSEYIDENNGNINFDDEEIEIINDYEPPKVPKPKEKEPDEITVRMKIYNEIREIKFPKNHPLVKDLGYRDGDFVDDAGNVIHKDGTISTKAERMGERLGNNLNQK